MSLSTLKRVDLLRVVGLPPAARFLPAVSRRAAPRRAVSQLLGLSLTVLWVGLSISLAIGLAPTAQAQDASQALAESLRERYEILPLQGTEGLALIPLDPPPGVRSVRIKGNEIRVNDALVPPDALRAWLRDDAEALLRLADLPPRARLRLLGFEAPELVAQGTPPPPSRAVESPLPLADAPEPDAPVLDAPVTGAEPLSPENPAEPEPSAIPELEIPEVPEPERVEIRIESDTRLSFGSSLTIEADEAAQEAVSFGGPVVVRGRVRGDVASFGGPVRVSGQVDGDISTFGGPVYLAETAVVYGDIITLGGNVEREDGAQHYGEVSGVNIGSDLLRIGDWDDFNIDIAPWGPWWGFDRHGYDNDIADAIGHMVLLGVLVCLVLALVRPRVERIRLAIAEEPWRAGFLGILATGLFGFVSLVLLVSIIGWPVLVLGVLAYIVFAVVGYAAVAYQLGRYLETRFDWHPGSFYLLALAGVLLIQGWSLAAEVMGLAGWPVVIFTVLLGLFGFCAQFAAWMVGLGGVVLSRSQPAVPVSGVPAPVEPIPATGPSPGHEAGPSTGPVPPPPVPPAASPGESVPAPSESETP